MTEGQKAMSWALRTHALTVYPVLSNQTYKTKNRLNKTITKYKCRLVVRIGNSEHKGKEQYKQDIEMTDKIYEIYLHYYNKRNK